MVVKSGKVPGYWRSRERDFFFATSAKDEALADDHTYAISSLCSVSPIHAADLGEFRQITKNKSEFARASLVNCVFVSEEN